MKKQLTDKQLAFLEALRNPENRGDMRVCKAVAGYSDASPLREIIKPIRDEVIEIAKDILAINAPKAAFAISEAVSDSTAPDMAERTKNAERILDRVGIVKGQELKVDVAISRIALIPARMPDERVLPDIA